MIGFTIILCIILYSIIHYLIKVINWFTEPDDYKPPVEKVNNISNTINKNSKTIYPHSVSNSNIERMNPFCVIQNKEENKEFNTLSTTWPTTTNTTINRRFYGLTNIPIHNYYIGDAYILTDNSESSANRLKCTYLLTDDIKEGDIVQLRKKDGTYRMTWSGKRPQRVSIRNVRYGRLPCAYEDMCWAEKV